MASPNQCLSDAMGLRPGVAKRPLQTLNDTRDVDEDAPSAKLLCCEEPKQLIINNGNSVMIEDSDDESDEDDEWDKKDRSWSTEVSGSILARTLLSGPPPSIRSSSYGNTSEVTSYYNISASDIPRLPPVSTIAYRGMPHVERDTSSPIPSNTYGQQLPQYWGEYYGTGNTGSVQTVQCEETGKSYFQLGNASPSYSESSSSLQGYRQQLLSVLHLSMCKLHRTRQVQDPRLRRSVLIYNTLRRLEREMAREGFRPTTVSSSSVPNPVYDVNNVTPPSPSPAPYEHSLRDLGAGARATPFPSPTREDTDSGLGEEVSTINWGSVLSLTAQTDLDSLNNNSLGELSYPSTSNTETTPSNSNMWINHDEINSSGLDDFSRNKLLSVGAQEIVNSVPSETTVMPARGKVDLFTEDLDKIMHVLVGT